MSFTYIIPFKYTDDRFNTLQKVLNNIKDLDCEVIVVEQGTQSILPDKNIIINQQYLFIDNPLPFNKSWGLNCAWKKASNNIIVFGDADNIIDPKHILEGVNEMIDYDFVSPHIRLIDLDPQESQMDLSKIYQVDRPGRGDLDHQKLPMCGAMTIFTKDSLERRGGWPEEFFGWGAEDDAMSIKVKNFLKWKENDNKCYHLYHQRVNPDMQWYYRNLQIYNNYLQSSKEQLDSYINSIKPLIGDKNRKFA